jgi:hypothetical protein
MTEVNGPQLRCDTSLPPLSFSTLATAPNTRQLTRTARPLGTGMSSPSAVVVTFLLTNTTMMHVSRVVADM